MKNTKSENTTLSISFELREISLAGIKHYIPSGTGFEELTKAEIDRASSAMGRAMAQMKRYSVSSKGLKAVFESAVITLADAEKATVKKIIALNKQGAALREIYDLQQAAAAKPKTLQAA